MTTNRMALVPIQYAAAEYFDLGVEEWAAAEERLRARGIEEYEPEIVDGSSEFAELWNVLHRKWSNTSENIELLVDAVEIIESDERAFFALYYLIDCIGRDLVDAMSRWEDVIIYEGSAEDYAQEYIEETTPLPDIIENYIDYERLAHDMQIEGSIYFDESKKFVVCNHSEM